MIRLSIYNIKLAPRISLYDLIDTRFYHRLPPFSTLFNMCWPENRHGSAENSSHPGCSDSFQASPHLPAADFCGETKFPLAIPAAFVYNTSSTMKYPPQAFVLRFRSRAMDACEPCQAGNRAALSGTKCAARAPVRSGCLRRVFHGAIFAPKRQNKVLPPSFFLILFLCQRKRMTA